MFRVGTRLCVYGKRLYCQVTIYILLSSVFVLGYESRNGEWYWFKGIVDRGFRSKKVSGSKKPKGKAMTYTDWEQERGGTLSKSTRYYSVMGLKWGT